jgi:Tol biopolymer transport system component
VNLSGTQIGPFQLLALLGVGGMGEVYRARDAKLGRDVAIKILPPSFAHDQERLDRFEREARTLASLNHPHIAAIYGFEHFGDAPALVLELIEGETLADRLARARTGLDVEESLSLAGQIADALEAAHERGIVHRDLKPANIMIGADGRAKILDFGLTKTAFSNDEPLLTNSPTAVAATRGGVLLGTAPYMSPEQARGKAVDKRADVWAFGCVLFEMITGRRAFDGETPSDAIAAVLERQPDWTALPPTVPPGVVRLLRRCLQKDARLRQRDLGDARLDLLEIPSDPLAASVGARRTWLPIAISALFTGFVVGGAIAWSAARRSGNVPESPVRRAVLPTLSRIGWNEPDFLGAALRNARSLAISRDGTKVVLVGRGTNDSMLYLRALDQSDARVIEGSAGATAPFWSPDGQWIGFFAHAKLRKVALAGGSPMTICDVVDDTGGSSAVWGKDGTIVFAMPTTTRAGLMRVSADGGVAEVLTTPDQKEGGGHGDPSFTLDERAILFATRLTRGAAPSIMVRSLVDGRPRKLVEGSATPFHTASGHLVFGRGTSLFAARFDAATLEITSAPVRVQDGVRTGQVAIAGDGLLAYVAEPRIDGRSLVWVDRTGAASPALAETRGFVRPRLSPDGRRLTVDIAADTGGPALNGLGNGSDVWVYNFQNGAFTRLTNNGRSNSPFWTRDGARIAFRMGASIQWQPADGSDTVDTLIEPTDPALVGGSTVAPGTWTPDGRTLVFVVHTSAANGADIWRLTMDGQRTVVPIVQRRGDQWSVRVSPDSRWLSYASNESGQFEIYVEPIGGGERHQVSIDGGEQAVWSPKGNELFYRSGDRMWVTEVASTATAFVASRPQVLFSGRYASTDLAAYDVTGDARRFLMVRPSDDEFRPAEIAIVENWFAELKRVPGR